MLNINTVYQGDCLEIMKEIDDKSIDMILADLPFYEVVEFKWDNEWKNVEEYINWCKDIIVEYKRIIKDNGNLFIFTGRQYNRKIATILDKCFNEKRIIIWARKRNFNNTRGKALASGYEPICYYCNGDTGTFNTIKIKPNTKRKEYNTGSLKNGITLSDVWCDIPALPHNSKEKVNHPTQKPKTLIERIIKIGSNEGDIILDNVAGSGTTGVVCQNLNRNFILIEKEPEYIEICKKRLKKRFIKEKNILSLFFE